jgi:hypothetical protein
VTLSFYARSSVDTTLCFMARNFDAGYYYVKEFSLTANTWKRVSHAIPGNANLVFNDDNGEGLGIWIILATGSDNDDSSDGAWNSSFELATSNQANFLASTSNILHLTGVQLEVGEQATPYKHRSFADELARCQRYYFTNGYGNPGGTLTGGATGIAFDAAEISVSYQFPVEMRVNPTITLYDNAGNSARVHRMRSADHGNATSAGLIAKTGFSNFGSTGLTTQAGYLAGLEANSEL